MKLLRLYGLLVFCTLLLLTTFDSIRAQTSERGVLAYVQGGEIWIQELPAGAPKQVTGDRLNSNPRWSPSGEWIAYYHKGVEWVIDRQGRRAQEMEGCVLDWHPVQDILLCYREDGLPQVAAAPDFARKDTLAGAGAERTVPYRASNWSPRGDATAYVRTDVLGESKDFPNVRASLRWVNLETGANTELFDNGSPSQDGLVIKGWSPDGLQVLYAPVPYFSNSIAADGLALGAVPAAGGTRRELVNAVLNERSFSSVAPGRNALAVAVGPYRGSWTNKRIALVNFATGTVQDLTDKSVAAISPAWAPVESRIAYVAMPDTGDLVGGAPARTGMLARRIWSMNADGSGKIQLTADATFRDEYPQWSADSTQIMFARIEHPDLAEEASDRAAVWRMNADGSRLEKVLDLNDATTTQDGAPLWFGYYGTIDWGYYYDWWQPPAKAGLPNTGMALPNGLLWFVSGFVLLLSGVSLLYRGAYAKTRQDQS